MPRDGWGEPEAEPGPSGSGGTAGSSGIRFSTMSVHDAVNSGVRFTPLEITQLQHEPNHMPRMKFEELCRNHEVYTLANAEYLVQLWNAGQEVPGQKYCNAFGARTFVDTPLGFSKRTWDLRRSGSCSGSKQPPQSNQSKPWSPSGRLPKLAAQRSSRRESSSIFPTTAPPHLPEPALQAHH